MTSAVLLLLVAIFAAALWSINSFGIPHTENTRYQVSRVSKEYIKNSITAIGTVNAVSIVQVSTQLSGQISQVLVDFNDDVVSGQPLAVLDSRNFSARVDQANAEMTMAIENVAILEARVERLRGMENKDIARRAVYKAKQEQASVKLRSAEQRLTRMNLLGKNGTSPDSSIDEAKHDRDFAAAAYREAKALAEAHEHEIASSQAGSREVEAELANARAAIPLRSASLSLAELDLDRATILSPIDGILVSRNIEPGQTVASQFDAPTLFSIAGNLREMEIHTSIDESDIGRISHGQEAVFNVDAYPDMKFQAKVKQIRLSPNIVQGVVLYTVVLDAANFDRMLLPGMTATVHLTTEEVGPVNTIPLAALEFFPDIPDIRQPDGSSNRSVSGRDKSRRVWVLSENGKVIPREVDLGVNDDLRIEVLGGDLAEGENVIVGNIEQSDRPWIIEVLF